MPFNLLKKYPDLLDLTGSLKDMKKSLRGVFDHDIANNQDFKFRGIMIHPLRREGEIEMDQTFDHLTTKEFPQYGDSGELLPETRRDFDMNRSRRLHWINHHVHELTPENIEVFTITEWDQKKRQDVRHTYIYDKVGKYVIVFDRRLDKDFYLLTAYYLDEPYAEKMMKKKLKKKEDNVL